MVLVARSESCFSVAHLHTNAYRVPRCFMITMVPPMETSKKVVLKALLTVFLCALALSIVGIALSLVQTSKSFSSVGTVKGVGVGIYWDSACTNMTSSINWGTVDPGSSKLVTLYVRNEGNTPITLSKTETNWTPSNAINYITLTWNYANQTLSYNTALQISLKLAVSSVVSGITSFTFDTTITASG
jgi:hypothetical protein